MTSSHKLYYNEWKLYSNTLTIKLIVSLLIANKSIETRDSLSNLNIITLRNKELSEYFDVNVQL